MTKTFSKIAGVLLLVVAAVHVYRIFAGLSVDVAGHPISMAVSVVAAVIAAVLGVMVLREARH